MDTPNGNEASLPLVLGEGWQMIPVDLARLCKAIWGVDFAGVEQVRLRAACAVRRVFLAERVYADVELPEYLRALG